METRKRETVMNRFLILSFQVGYTKMKKGFIKVTFSTRAASTTGEDHCIMICNNLQTYTGTLMFTSLFPEVHLLGVSHPPRSYMYFHRNNWFLIFHFTLGKGPYLFLDSWTTYFTAIFFSPIKKKTFFLGMFCKAVSSDLQHITES